MIGVGAATVTFLIFLGKRIQRREQTEKKQGAKRGNNQRRTKVNEKELNTYMMKYLARKVS
jgi:hypothetical protein